MWKLEFQKSSIVIRRKEIPSLENFGRFVLQGDNPLIINAKKKNLMIFYHSIFFVILTVYLKITNMFPI